MEDLIVLMEL